MVLKYIPAEKNLTLPLDQVQGTTSAVDTYGFWREVLFESHFVEFFFSQISDYDWIIWSFKFSNKSFWYIKWWIKLGKCGYVRLKLEPLGCRQTKECSADPVVEKSTICVHDCIKVFTSVIWQKVLTTVCAQLDADVVLPGTSFTTVRFRRWSICSLPWSPQTCGHSSKVHLFLYITDILYSTCTALCQQQP